MNVLICFQIGTQKIKYGNKFLKILQIIVS